MITSFRGAHAFLSNFYASPMMVDGHRYPTVEHAFQAAKTENPKFREMIRTALTPSEAKRLGRIVPLRKDWNDVRLETMEYLLRIKFRSPALCRRLLETDDEELIEGNTWNDTFWGKVFLQGEWQGENHLGRLLMKIREESRDE